MERILVAGGSGSLGLEVLRLMRREGWPVRATTRGDPNRSPLLHLVDEVVSADLTHGVPLRGLCRGVGTVFSCAGASMRLGGLTNRQSFSDVNWKGNLRLLNEARAAGVRRFVFVSVFGGERLRHTAYADAHERFADTLRESGLDYAIIRPTGFFSFLGEVMRMAERGAALVVGTGEARTNPVHQAEVAEVCVAAVRAGGEDLPVGGPEILSRREIVELAFEAVGRAPRLRSVSPRVLRSAALPLALANPRLHALMKFGVEVSQVDVIAPTVGRRTLRSYFAELADRRATAM